MRIRNKFTINMLMTALFPLIISMGLALWHSTNQTTKLTLNVTQGRLDTAAQELSSFFSERIAEVSTYSQTSKLKTMHFPSIRPFLMSELSRHENIYEKFILGTPEGYFYNTSGGNPYVRGLRTSNDRSPKAKPKHIRKRDYWQKTVGKNNTTQHITYVSDPMISYTTGAKQIVVASTILSNKNKIKGMIGGALPWQDIQRRINIVTQQVTKQLGWNVKFFLISNTGTYWYHWNPKKVVHLKLDKRGKPLLNDIGEKEIIKNSILNESIPEIVEAGKRMIQGEHGHSEFIDFISKKTQYVVFSQIPSANYSLGLVVPREQVLGEVNNLQSLFIYIFLAAAFFTILIAFILSKNISSPIISLNAMAKKISRGDWETRLKLHGQAEIRELTESFNSMAKSLKQRELLIKNSEENLEIINSELEKRISERTQELKETNLNLEKQIQQRLIAQISLKNREQLLANTGQLAHVGGWKFDILNNNLNWTDETYHLHALDTNKTPSLEDAINYFLENSRIILTKALNKAKEHGTPFDLELQLLTEDKKQIWVRMICHATKKNNKVIELIGAYQDITELKKVETLKNEFVSTVSHELRTPLTAIHGSLSILNSDNTIRNDELTSKNMLDIAERNSERLILLINDLLDIEKIESGKINFSLSHYNLRALLEQSVIENESYAKKYNVSINITTDIPDISINVDQERFFQVMANLLSNAIKFTEKNSSVDITASTEKKQVTISVRDYGDGIPEHFRGEIFTKFSQADSSDTRKPGGTGLGLAITKSIVEIMGGNIGYETVAKEGTRFYFTLPILDN